MYHPNSSIVHHPHFYHQIQAPDGSHLKEYDWGYPPLLSKHDPLLLVPTFYFLDHLKPNPNTVIYKKGKVDDANLGFEASIDVSHYLPHEITARMVPGKDKDDTGTPSLLIEGKHEERLDEHGFISRQFKRRYSLPQNINGEELMVNLSNDGILSVTAPKMKMIEDKHVGVGGAKGKEVPLPIHLTGKREICCEKKRTALLGNEGCGRVQGEAKPA